MNFPARSALLPAAVAAACLATACSTVLGLGSFKNGPADAGSSEASAGSGGSTQTDGGGGAAGTAGGGGTAGSDGGGCTSNTDCQASGSGPICNKSSGQCVQCVTAGDCSGDAGSADCCGSKCVDLSSDPHNCGACGHDCLGGACTAGQCQPVVIGQTNDNVSVMALNGGYLYWGIFDSGSTAAVKRIPVAGGNAQIVAKADYAYALAFDSNNIYFVTGNSAASKEVPVVGKTPKVALGSFTQLYPDPNLDGGTAGIPGISMGGAAVAGTQLYWILGSSTSTACQIETVNIGGTSAAHNIAISTDPARFDHRPLATDGQYVYWYDTANELKSSKIVGGGTHIVVSNSVYGDLALSSNNVYFLEKYSNNLWYVAYASASGLKQDGGTLLSPGETQIQDLVVDGTTVFWSAGAKGTVKSLTFGSKTPTVLASAANAQFLAVDAKSIYWWSSGDWKFYRLAR